MKCPKEIRACPHNWTNCELCANLKACNDGTYTPELEPTESDLDIVIKAAEISERVIQAEVVESVIRIRGTWSERFSQMTENERWAEYRKHKPPDLLAKEPYKCMSGPTAPGGGSSGKIKKSKKGNKPTVYVWGENT
jgi:hypothetical protein